MKGSVEIVEFVRFLTDNNLVIAPAPKMVFDAGALKKKILKQRTVTYADIHKAKLWGDITRKRVYQIAKEFARDGEIIKPIDKPNSKEKIVLAAVLRIAKMRGHE